MRALLDTHSFLWFVSADPKLSSKAEALISEGANELLLSVASLWEVSIKVSLGRLPLAAPVHEFIPEQLRRNRIDLLPIEMSHTFEVARLPFHHRDPFDRLLIAQALVENLPIVSVDSAFDAYSVERIW